MANPDFPTPFDVIKDRFSKHSDFKVLSHILGITSIDMGYSEDPEISRVYNIAEQLARHTVVICLDTEHWTLNSDEMTEIGIVVLHSQDVAPISRAGEFGDHGFNIMEQARFHFLRLKEKTHLPTSNIRSRGPEGNSFGHERFVTFTEARSMLWNLMIQPIDHVPSLRGYNRPIVLMGHSVGHDREHLNGKDLRFDIDSPGTVARVIDTQQITLDSKHWFGCKDPIGLRTLVQKLEFHHTNSHTAANDAARTFIAGVLMVLPKGARQNCRRNTQKVVYDLETSSRESFVPLGGVALYCCECGEDGHMGDQECMMVGKIRRSGVPCAECVSRGFDKTAWYHVEAHCHIVRDEVAAERLAWYKDQPAEWKPKYPFVSNGRLQAYAPDSPTPTPATEEEIVARSAWYDMWKDSSEVQEPFVWVGRSFANSPLAGQGPPPGQKVRRHYPSVPAFPPTPPPVTTLPMRPGGPSPRGDYVDRRPYGNNMGGHGSAQPSYPDYAVQPYGPQVYANFAGDGSPYYQPPSYYIPGYVPGHDNYPPLDNFNSYQTGPYQGGYSTQFYGVGYGDYPDQYRLGRVGGSRGRGNRRGRGDGRGRGGCQ